MEKRETIQKLYEFIDIINRAFKNVKTIKDEQKRMVRSLNSDIFFIQKHILTEKVMKLIIKETESKVKKLIEGLYEQA